MPKPTCCIVGRPVQIVLRAAGYADNAKITLPISNYAMLFAPCNILLESAIADCRKQRVLFSSRF
uniref:Uncharacterized protein n=1 Tax=Arundo donax TaxID=35708 RepID=A0A0A9AC08_ARUDO